MSIPKIVSIITLGVQDANKKPERLSNDFGKMLNSFTSSTKYEGLDALATLGKTLIKKTSTLKDITFHKGIALNKDGSRFSGFIEDKLQSGDSIRLFYKDGIIQQSAKKGSASFDKCYLQRGREYDVIKLNHDNFKKEIACYELHSNGKVAFVKCYDGDTAEFSEYGRYLGESESLHDMFRKMFAEEDFDLSVDFQPLFKF